MQIFMVWCCCAANAAQNQVQLNGTGVLAIEIMICFGTDKQKYRMNVALKTSRIVVIRTSQSNLKRRKNGGI